MRTDRTLRSKRSEGAGGRTKHTARSTSLMSYLWCSGNRVRQVREGRYGSEASTPPARIAESVGARHQLAREFVSSRADFEVILRGERVAHRFNQRSG